MTEEYKYNCIKCNYYTNYLSNYSRHQKTKKHINNHIEELKEKEIENKNRKFSCEICKYYTDNINGLSQHKRTKKHTKNINNKDKKKEIEEKYGLIYLIKLTITNEKNKNIYKFGYSRSSDLSRLEKGYKGIMKIKKELILKSVYKPKYFEDYIKENIKDNKNYEKYISNSGEFFSWNNNDEKLLNYFNILFTSYKCNINYKSMLSYSGFNDIKIE